MNTIQIFVKTLCVGVVIVFSRLPHNHATQIVSFCCEKNARDAPPSSVLTSPRSPDTAIWPCCAPLVAPSRWSAIWACPLGAIGAPKHLLHEANHPWQPQGPAALLCRTLPPGGQTLPFGPGVPHWWHQAGVAPHGHTPWGPLPPPQHLLLRLPHLW